MKYYRIILGKQNIYAKSAREEGFVGADFDIDGDLTGKLPDNWREFNKKYIPIFLKKHPEKSKIAAGLACGMLHTIAKGLDLEDVVLCPDGQGSYYVGKVSGEYYYKKGQPLPHRRPVTWFNDSIARSAMSQELQNSTGSIGTVSNVTDFAKEIEGLIEGNEVFAIVSTDETVEDPTAFALEKHLEDFLVQNWVQTELGKKYEVFSEGGEVIGQQYPTDTGPIDILAISKDGKELLVVELKKGRASDVVIGQVQRYMGYVKDELADKGQRVMGVIIALEGDLRIERALSINPDISFYNYKVSFKLEKKK